MGKYNDYNDEFARADARERELQRQMGMRDGVSGTERYVQNNYGQQGYNNYNYNSNYGYGQVPQSIWDGASQSKFIGAVSGGRQKGMPPNPRAAKAAMTALAVIFYFTAVIMLGVMFITVSGLRKDYKECNVDVQAEVIENVRKSRGVNKGKATYPVFRYEYDGNVYEQMGKTGNTSAKYSIGEKVTLHIDPNSPTKFYVEKEDRFVIIVISSLAVLFFTLGMVFTIGSLKKKKQIQSMLE